MVVKTLKFSCWYLFYGNSLKSIAYDYRMGKETARQIVLETSQALDILDILSPIVVQAPTTSKC